MNSGGSFGTAATTYDSRELFKHSLRTYERSNSRHKAPRPAFSAIYGNRNMKIDPKFIAASTKIPTKGSIISIKRKSVNDY